MLFIRGAEAEVCEGEYLGKKAVLKKRTPKGYRNKQLDERIRNERTKAEAGLLHKAKESGVRTPLIYDIDYPNATITMERIEGKRMKDVLNNQNAGMCRSVGKNIALLHMNGVIHGDLTTSNVLVKGKGLVLIDFGLGFFSRKTEDFAVDLLNFKKTFTATHAGIEKGWGLVMGGYTEKMPSAKKILRQVDEVEKRGRYH